MDSEPAWDAHLTYLGPHDHVHAVGAFALAHNWLESQLYIFFQHYFPDDGGVRDHLFDSLHNRERVDLIKLCASRAHEPDLRDAVHYAMKCFDACKDNRNLLLHAAPAFLDADHLVLAKHGARGMNLYAFPLKALRATALEADAVRSYFEAINTYIVELNPEYRSPGEPPPALPERPAQPRSLSLSRLPEGPPNA